MHPSRIMIPDGSRTLQVGRLQEEVTLRRGSWFRAILGHEIGEGEGRMKPCS